MKAAVACYPVGRPRSWAAWEDKVAGWVAGAEADLLVFPEYGAMELAALAGAEGLGAELRAVSEALPRAWDHLAALAARHRAHILAPSGPVWTTRGPVNRAMFLTPGGKRQAHDKRIPTPWERAPMGIVPGGDPVLMRTDLGLIGVQICYDCEFPLATRALAEAGMEVLCVPSQTEALAGYSRVRIGAMARALEAQCFVLHAPTQGRAEGSQVVDENAGAAGVYAPPDAGFPESGVLAQGAMDTPGWTRAELDTGALARLRAGGAVAGLADWQGQYGAGAAPSPPVTLVDLR